MSGLGAHSGYTGSRCFPHLKEEEDGQQSGRPRRPVCCCVLHTVLQLLTHVH